VKLKLSELASLAEVIGAVAIVISLVYVGIQVSDSTQAGRSAAANETSSAISSWYSAIGSNQQASQVFLDGISNPGSLSREETAQFIYLMHGLMLEYQNAYYLSQEGTLEVELQESLTNTILGVKSQPGFLMYWEQRRGLFKTDFKEYMEDLVATGTPNTDMERLYQLRE